MSVLSSLPLLGRMFSSSSSSSIQVLKTVAEMRAWRRAKLLQSKTVGLVPTMGALHKGHLGLVSRSLEETDATVVSIFVNPTQFSPSEDLDQYPRTVDEDLLKLESVVKTDNDNNKNKKNKEVVVFLPSVKEMYPNGVTLEISQQKGAFVSVQGLSEQLEGAIRPHFFRGVATVVCKLLNAVTPDRAYFGQKDIQQTVVVKRMVKDLLMPTEIVVCPIVREANGLAMSSRNEYLTAESKDKASLLYRALCAGEDAYKNRGVELASDIIKVVKDQLEADSEFPIEVEYIAISDRETLQDVGHVTRGEGEGQGVNGVIMSAAVRVPNKSGTQTRIIDNVILA